MVDLIEPVALPLPTDDVVIIFRTDKSRVHGRLVRIGSVAETILARHEMPDAASAALGEALALAALLGSALPAAGNISVQTRTTGPVSVLYADCDAPGRLRGYARYDAHALVAKGSAAGISSSSAGEGHLAITIDQGDAAERYQGVIALDGQKLADGAAAYFESREDLPTFVRLAVAQHYSAATPADVATRLQWRGGGIMMQNLGEQSPIGDDETDDPWQRVRMLTGTIEAHELLDPLLEPERLLLRLFHEEGVIIERVVPLSVYCKCSREKIAGVLLAFGPDELADMVDADGKILVNCEFCGTNYPFDPAAIAETTSS